MFPGSRHLIKRTGKHRQTAKLQGQRDTGTGRPTPKGLAYCLGLLLWSPGGGVGGQGVTCEWVSVSVDRCGLYKPSFLVHVLSHDASDFKHLCA